MDAEQLMVNEPFDEVEPAPPKDQPSDKLAQRRNPLPMIRRAPEDKDSHERHQPDHRMKEPIPDHIHLHGFERCRGHPVGEHVVPLQELVQDNTIDKAPKPMPSTIAARCAFRCGTRVAMEMFPRCAVMADAE